MITWQIGIDLVLPEAAEKRDLKVLFMNKEGSDIKFQVENKIIHGHKEILINRSCYFANLFQSKKLENFFENKSFRRND